MAHCHLGVTVHWMAVPAYGSGACKAAPAVWAQQPSRKPAAMRHRHRFSRSLPASSCSRARSGSGAVGAAAGAAYARWRLHVDPVSRRESLTRFGAQRGAGIRCWHGHRRLRNRRCRRRRRRSGGIAVQCLQTRWRPGKIDLPGRSVACVLP